MEDFALNPLTVAGAWLQTFLLVFLRVGGVFLRAPLLGSNLFPANVRIWLSFFCALVMFPAQLEQHGSVLLTQSTGVFFVACLAELSLGILIGFCAQMLLFGLMMAGHIVDTELSFSMAQLLDPTTQETSSLVSQLLFLGGTVLFLALDGHHAALHALRFSFDRIPLFAVNLNDDVLRWVLLELAPQVFVIGVTFAAPVLAAVLLSTVGLGLVARVVPEMNIFAFAFPVRLGVGFVFLELSVRYMAPVADRLVQGTLAHLAQLLARAA
ncbi:MAG: flagellar biosynthetic protein FliR [Planctomycetes bacterium]|nr:flagellar biosynthetic protein FliR [Planctomycetota bacterium]